MRYYYLDASVGNIHGFEALFMRAQSFAASALERLTDHPLDPDFARVFEHIFKTPVTDLEPMRRSADFRPTNGQGFDQEPRPVLAHVCRELYSFANDWSRTLNRTRADVCIHFDGSVRYVRHPGYPRGLFDPVNHMFASRSIEEMEWLWHNTLAFVSYCHPLDPNFNPLWEHPQRNVIDFTHVAVSIQATWEKLTGASLGGLQVGAVATSSLEIILIHEMMHCEVYGLQDFWSDSGPSGGTGGWDVIMSVTKEQSYVCAESIAMLCLAAALADLQPMHLPRGYGYTIRRDGRIVTYRKRILM